MKKQQNKTPELPTTQPATQTDAAAPLPAPRVPVEVESRDEKEIREIGEAIIRKTGEVAGLYLSLCLNIRANKIGPAIVTRILKELGFHKVRISEINKVANAPDDVFSHYQARAIGFNKALEFARVEADGVKETPAALMLKNSGVSPMSADEVGEAIAGDDGKPGEEKKPASKSEKIARCVKVIFTNATKPKVWKSGTGWQLVLSKCKVEPEPEAK